MCKIISCFSGESLICTDVNRVLTEVNRVLEVVEVREPKELPDVEETKNPEFLQVEGGKIYHNSNTKQPLKTRYRKSDAVRELERLADAYDRERYPNIPEHCRPKNLFRDDTANGLTRCIVAYIHYKGGQAERINTTGIPIDERRLVRDVVGRTRTIGGLRWRRGGGTCGSADISATIRGRSVKIEVKIGRDRQSEAQKRYQADIEKAGGLYFIAHNFTEFLDWYKMTFAKEEGGAK